MTSGQVAIPLGLLGPGLYDVYYFYADYTVMPGSDKVTIEVATGYVVCYLFYGVFTRLNL